MSKLPRLLPAELIRALERAGYHKDHQTGSHLVLHHPDGRRVMLPVHDRELGVGLTHEIIKQAGLTAEELSALLR